MSKYSRKQKEMQVKNEVVERQRQTHLPGGRQVVIFPSKARLYLTGFTFLKF